MTGDGIGQAEIRGLLLDLARERSLEGALRLIPERLAELPGVALARIWLIRAGDRCDACAARAGCPGQVPCLQLSASAGRPRDRAERWERLDGRFSRLPIGSGKVGRVAQSGEPLISNDLARNPDVLKEPEWARAERLQAFGGQPLRYRGETLGVLGVFLRVPFSESNLDQLRTVADHAAAAIATARAFEEIESLRARLEVQNEVLREEVREAGAFSEMIGDSPALRRVQEQVGLVAPTDATVLVTGETGTGKELVAREIHAASGRAARPLVRVNCAAIPAELFESEFFGHVRGAFTGASRDHIGRFAAAEGGTLFLDEVGEIPLSLQPKLLRAIESGEYERVGDHRPRVADVRIVAATNRDLGEAVRAGAFREDLYYRLNVFPIEMPPLRVRPTDVARLASHFLRRSHGAAGLELSAANRAELEAYDWPGNVRELRNVIERAAIVTPSGPLRLQLGVKGRAKARGVSWGESSEEIFDEDSVRDFTRRNLARALEHCGWRIYGDAGAAALLGIRPTTLVSRMKRFGLARPRSQPRGSA